MSYNLKELLSRATDKIKKDVLCSSFVFPRTESLKDDKPCMQMEVDSLDFEAILRFIDSKYYYTFERKLIDFQIFSESRSHCIKCKRRPKTRGWNCEGSEGRTFIG